MTISLAEYKALETRMRSYETLTKQLGSMANGLAMAVSAANALRNEFADANGVDELAAAQALLERARQKLQLPALNPSDLGGPEQVAPVEPKP